MSGTETKEITVLADKALHPVLQQALQERQIGPVVFCSHEDIAGKQATFAILQDSAEKNSCLPARNVFYCPLRLGAFLDRAIAYRQEPAQEKTGRKITIGPYILDPAGAILLHEAKDPIQLTEKECAVLLYLHEHPGEVVSRRALLEEIWGYAENTETHTLETHIYRLRQKIEPFPATPEILLTEEDGYRLLSMS